MRLNAGVKRIRDDRGDCGGGVDIGGGDEHDGTRTGDDVIADRAGDGGGVDDRGGDDWGGGDVGV